MSNEVEEDWKALGAWVKRRRLAAGYADIAEWSKAVGRSARVVQGLERGERAGPKTLQAVADRLLDGDATPLYEVLSSDGDGAAEDTRSTRGEEPDDPPHRSQFDRLSQEADEAQAEFERAVGDLVAAEARLDAASRSVFGYLAFEQKVHIEIANRERELGRKLTQVERLAIDEVDRPTPRDVAELIATHAEMDPHEWTRYEMALMEVFHDHKNPVEAGSRYADLAPARARAARLITKREEGGDDGTQASAQKTEHEDEAVRTTGSIALGIPPQEGSD